MRFPSQSNLVCPYLVRSSHIFAKIHAFRECFPKYVWLLYYTPFFNSKCADGTGLTRWYNMSLPSFSLPSTDEEARAKIQQAIGPHENLLTIVKRRKLQWYRHVSRSSGLAKTILRGTVRGNQKQKQGKHKKRWEDNIRKRASMQLAKSQGAVENREKWRKVIVKSSAVPQRPWRLRDGRGPGSFSFLFSFPIP